MFTYETYRPSYETVNFTISHKSCTNLVPRVSLFPSPNRRDPGDEFVAAQETAKKITAGPGLFYSLKPFLWCLIAFAFRGCPKFLVCTLADSFENSSVALVNESFISRNTAGHLNL